MTPTLPTPTLYLITSGAARSSSDFPEILDIIAAATRAGLHLIQLREKLLPARLLFELTLRAAEITRGTGTRLLVNDRADIARAARADGVHLTTRSLEPGVVRRAFGQDFLIGASTHSLAEARAARRGGADFAVFGPIFETPSKKEYGPALGLEKLSEAARELAPFPLLALGGLTRENSSEALRTGASGIAGISLYSDSRTLAETVQSLRSASRTTD